MAGLTYMRRRLKRLRTALNQKRMAMGMLMAAAVLVINGQFNAANPLLFGGIQIYRRTKQELRELESPYSFRDVYPDYHRCNLDSFSEEEYHDTFRFDKPLTRKFVNYLIRFKRIPPVVRVPYMANYRLQYHVYELEELVLMVLMYCSRPTRQLEVALKFGRTIPEVSIGMSYFHELLFPIAKDFLQNEQQAWFDQQTVETCAEVIAEKGCPLLNCCGFVDGNLQQLSNPGVAWLQNQLYNGHKKMVGYQWIGVVVPNGMCLLSLGPSPGRRHDAAVSAIHNLYGKLNRLVTFPNFRGCFSGDKAFPTFWPLIPMHSAALTPAQADWNTNMSRSRITVEWQFGETVQQFSSLSWSRRQRVLASPVHEWYLNCNFLNNLLNTQYPNAISQYFNMRPPLLETYLNVPIGSLN